MEEYISGTFLGLKFQQHVWTMTSQKSSIAAYHIFNMLSALREKREAMSLLEKCMEGDNYMPIMHEYDCGMEHKS